MSLFSIPTKKHTAFYDNLYSSASRTPTNVYRINRKTTDMSKDDLTLGNSKSDDTTRSLDKSKEINRTYVVSGLSKSAGLQIRGGVTPASGRLTLQRRKTGAENAEKTMNENTQNSTLAPEKRLTLQRRTRTGSIVKSEDKDIRAATERQRLVSGPVMQMPKVLSESNYGISGGAGVLRSASLRDNATKTKSKEFATPVNTPGKGVERPTRFAQKQPLMVGRPLSDFAKSEEHRATTSTPTKKTQFEKLAAKKDVFEKLAGRTVPKAVAVKSLSLERPKTYVQLMPEDRKHIAAPGANKFSAGALTANVTTNVPPAQVRKNATPVSADHNEDARVANGPTPALAPTPVLTEALVRPSTVSKQQESLKMENSAVTVAVRVRPFNAREKTEKAFRVIYMNGQETVVKHPDSKQSHSFTYDYSFCSVDQQEVDFAGQQTVYEKLAKPLLERALEGFNTCLFAYGQTGSGKSYTMMGFGEETGVIPRFCEELFSRLSSIEDQEVTCHLEMSYFEVYNEKIHDLLVARDTPNQKSLPLRVREHPVHGPYVAELSTNVVTSYRDIQGWLELGNQQRATAATGMNDKSSRSHSVFTLVMTQTTTEFVEEEEHDHRITSRINLVDLAGSERCSSAQTSGDRLREGASINKSLLTLGKVISALSEQAQTSRKVFTPYRESVLTWLLKESLGGNSKTAMIATLSPAGSNVEESLSTLRYARQARMIINLAKVNEDTNAKLIRELKAEVEKLRAAQMSSRGLEPEKMRLFQQEIAALRGQLSQQEREMAEAHRAWREKLEQAEKRKREENKELQRAAVTFKVDNRLPNLVNLNEDPQLSEMLLYMIHEGQTRVGQHKSEAAHDIQLSGALIAVHHCVISNVDGTVSLTPMENAKTFVNGNLISEATVLHHGDRVILGGDHYFRFNHPAEVQSGKRVSCWTGAGDGQRDFEFAKNELLAAQRAQLEAEIQEARVKAKEEMMQGIQMAKEMAQKEMSEQRATYEDRIVTLERELEEESERKRCQEQHQQEVVSQMAELQSAKSQLEQEVDAQKKRLRLHLEAQTARQAMEDHSVRQAKIVEALEAEKKKISKDLEEMQKKMALRGNRNPKSVPPQWDAMKLSFMIEEANKISAKLRKHTVFSRHEGSEKENPGLQVQVHNTKMGISTFWSLEKFQSSLAAMRELDQEEQGSKDDDVFYDPNDEWEQDLSVTSSSSSTSSFSRRRSRSLLKSRRISGRLYEIRVHPIQSLLGNTSNSSQSGLMGVAKPPSTNSASPDSALPGICKDMIGKTLVQLRRYGGSEVDEGESLADRLTSDLCCVYSAVRTISGLYEGLDDNSQEKVFVCNLEAQTQLVRATSAIERAVFVTMQWVSSSSSSRSYSGPLYTTAEELKTQVKRMGGFFQLLVQGCDSEISSMVTEAQKKSGQCLDAAVRTLSHLAALTGTPLRATELDSEAVGKPSLAVSLLEGTNQGVRSLVGEGLTIAKEMLREAQLAYPRTPVLQSLKSKMLDLASCLQSYIHCNLTEREENFQRNGVRGSGGGGGGGGEEEEADPLHLQRLRNTAAKQFQLNQAIRQLHGALSLALRGKGTDSSLYLCQASLSASLSSIDDVVSGWPKETGASSLSCGLQLPCVQSVVVARDELQVALQSLSTIFSHQGAAEKSESLASGDSVKDDKSLSNEGSTTSAPNPLRNRTVTKMVYSLFSVSKGDPHWV